MRIKNSSTPTHVLITPTNLLYLFFCYIFHPAVLTSHNNLKFQKYLIILRLERKFLSCRLMPKDIMQ